MKITHLTALCLLSLPTAAFALPITYEIVTTGEFSSFNGGVTSDAPITFVATADTANLQEQVGLPTGSRTGTIYVNFNSIQLDTLTVTIAGSPTATFLSPPSLEYAYAPQVSLTSAPFPIGITFTFYAVPTPPTTPDILANATTSPIILPSFAFIGSAATDRGTLTVEGSPTGYTTTLSVSLGTPIPEPSSTALTIAALLASLSIGLVSKLRRTANNT